MEENKMAKGLIVGFLAGGIIGAVVALLYAPKSGRELRAEIGKKKDEILDDATEYMQIAKTKAAELINEGKKKSEHLIDEAKKKAGTIIEDANKVLSDAKEKTADKIGSMKEKFTTEAERVKDAFKAGLDAYNEEKKKPI
jgi:gas vesicle protein